MPEAERVQSDRVLELARTEDVPLLLFLRRQAGLERTDFTCRLLDFGTPKKRRLILESPANGPRRLPLEAGEEVEFFFELDGVGYAFHTRVVDRVHFAPKPGSTVAAVWLEYPPHVIKIQRRSYYRALAPLEPPVTVRFRVVTRPTSAEDRAFTSDFPYEGRMHDIAGAGMAFATDSPPEAATELNARLIVAFRLTDEDPGDIVLDALVRGVTERRDGSTMIRVAWLTCHEDDPETGPLARRIFHYIAERQRALLEERAHRLHD